MKAVQQALSREPRLLYRRDGCLSEGLQNRVWEKKDQELLDRWKAVMSRDITCFQISENSIDFNLFFHAKKQISRYEFLSIYQI